LFLIGSESGCDAFINIKKHKQEGASVLKTQAKLAVMLRIWQHSQPK
jgi:hypothetical protein